MQDPIINDFRLARTRLLLLDYDGTLVNFAPTPLEAKPSTQLLDILGKLCADKRNTVVIVSGRPKHTLEDWLGHLPITLVAEHGFFIKHPGRPWSTSNPVNDSWKSSVRDAMQPSAKAVAKSFIEEKDSSLVWHYRTANDESVANEIPNILKRLHAPVDLHKLTLLQGHKNVEVRQGNANKGSAASLWLQDRNWDFMLAAGDDVTDEDLFAAMPASAVTIKIGPGESKATSRLPDPDTLLKLLESFI